MVAPGSEQQTPCTGQLRTTSSQADMESKAASDSSREEVRTEKLDTPENEKLANECRYSSTPDAPARTQDGVNAEAASATTASKGKVDGDTAAFSIWTAKQKRIIVVAASMASLLSPLSGQIYFPALDAIAKDLKVSDSLVNLSITTFLIFQAVAPTFTAQLSDTVGRRPLYMVCFVLYAAANIGLGVQNDYAALMVLRCLQSAGSGGVVALSNAVAADITTRAERGKYVAYAAAIPMLGPTLGPIVGGLLAQFAGWHSIFWFLLALTGAVGIPMALFFPETCRKVVQDGSVPPQPWNKSFTNMIIERRASERQEHIDFGKRKELSQGRQTRLPNPFAPIMLLLEPVCGFALLYNSLLCCSFYATLALIPSQFQRKYGFNELQIALCYIPFGVGGLIAAFSRGRMLDSNFRRHAKRLGVPIEKNRQTDMEDFPIERARIEVALPTILLGSACLIGFGWTVEAKTNLAGPLIFLFVLGFCISASLNSVACLTLDVYPTKAATVSASNNLLRCLLGAGATAAIVPMINAIRVGWSVTIFALINIVALPLLWYVMRQGPSWRSQALKKKKEELERKAAIV